MNRKDAKDAKENKRIRDHEFHELRPRAGGDTRIKSIQEEFSSHRFTQINTD